MRRLEGLPDRPPSRAGRRAAALWPWMLGCLLASGLGLMAARNLGYAGLWYDEAMQIWVSQGAGAWAQAEAPTPSGGWRDVVRLNGAGNLDPGGYSLFLHAWVWAGHGIAWLRLSAFLFHLLGAWCLALLARELTGSRSAALLAPFLPLAYPSVLYYAFEIRAYSMELAGVFLAGYLLHRAVRAGTTGSHLAVGLALSVFLWSRYSFAIVTASALMVLAVVQVRAGRRGAANPAGLLWCLPPLLGSAVAIHRLALGPQRRWGFARATAGTIAASFQAPEYVERWVLRGRSAGVALGILRENLLSSPALPITLALALLAAWPWVVRPALARVWPGARTFPAAAGLALGAQALSLGLSLGGYYPWDMGQKWSLYLHGVSILCLLYLGSAVWCLARTRRMAPALAVAATLAAGALAGRAAAFRHVHWADLGPSLAWLDALRARPTTPPGVFVGIYEVPAVRYFYELGPRRGARGYPATFRFETPGEARARSPIDVGTECIRYVVSARGPEWGAERIRGGRLRRVPGPSPSHLWQVEPDPATPCRAATREPRP